MPHFIWNGHRLIYRYQGNGPLLLVLPGNTASSACHQGELDAFSDRYQVVCLDFLGTGQSDRLEAWPDGWWPQAASQAGGLVSHLEVARCTVLGTSGGAAVALLMAIHYPGLVQAVIADSCAEKFSSDMARR